MLDPGIHRDTKRLAELGREHQRLAGVVSRANRLTRLEDELAQVRELVAQDEPEMRAEAQAETVHLEAGISQLEEEIKPLLVPPDPLDDRNAIVEIRAGTGGDEAALFAAELYRMYTRYIERHAGWKAETLSLSDGSLGGYKEAVFKVTGAGAFGELRREAGVHRVQRVPATEASGRIHTSAATVAVLPEAEEVDVSIEDKDLRIDVYRASGHGGQNVQKNSTAIRITHIPTGIVVTCQNERSQGRNRESAMKVLEARLLELELVRREEEKARLKGVHVDMGWGNQIRSYVLHPYKMVKDHRTDHETTDTMAVLDGELDDFMAAFLESRVGEEA